ncbi:hypothetical protein CIG75_05325 [Tumebacillus algifaecis]|uniref:Uncharacterized protein n=1 Tax=Tumebacillus algifaecis TaxID=1214604 RepID=A0A223CYT1_9BACL|nr:DUF523 domain-containing protein [Tumebacillus algifaecis]ASS74468.1 hypothetical protein CIG75_05325 [Tumebacillus algifaecis]
MKVISACLVGCQCRYDGDDNLIPAFQQMVEQGEAVFVCPEQLGGLSTPRPPAEIVGGTGEDVLDGKAKVLTNQGVDVTDQFLKGAQQALKMAQLVGAQEAILKERSPSCGSALVYDGTFSGDKRPGDGVTSALLKRHGIAVFSEETYANKDRQK